MSVNINYYQILEVNKNASQKEITSAYHKLSLVWHPDRITPQGYTKEQQTSKFQELQKAYEVLSDEEKRKSYDLEGSENGVHSDDWYKDKANSILGEGIERLKELFAYYGANENDLDPKLWTPFDSWEDKVWHLYENEVNKHNDFMELLREESQKAGVKKKSNSSAENIPPRKEIEDKKESETPQIPYHNEKSLKENPTDKEAVKKVDIVKDNDNKNDNQNLVVNLGTIKKITLTSKGELVIEFNENKGVVSITQTITTEQINQSKELQKAKNYLQKESKSSINQQEFNNLLKTNSTGNTTEKPENNYGLWIGGGITVLVLGVVVGLLISKRRNRKIK